MKKPARSEYFFGCVLLIIGVMVGHLSMDFLDDGEIQSMSVEITMSAIFILLFTVLMEILYVLWRRKKKQDEGRLDIPATTIILLLVIGFLASICMRLINDVTGMKEFLLSEDQELRGECNKEQILNVNIRIRSENRIVVPNGAAARFFGFWGMGRIRRAHHRLFMERT